MAGKEPLALNEEDALVLGYVTDFYELLRAIDEVMPKDAVLYVEGTDIAPDVAAFLDARRAADPPDIEPNTRWPKPTIFHLSLGGTNLSDLRKIAESHAEPEVADHLVVYRGADVLLWAHDAGAGYVEVSRSLPAGVITGFKDSLGDALRRRT
jgi:hypothetical protein